VPQERKQCFDLWGYSLNHYGFLGYSFSFAHDLISVPALYEAFGLILESSFDSCERHLVLWSCPEDLQTKNMDLSSRFFRVTG